MGFLYRDHFYELLIKFKLLSFIYGRNYIQTHKNLYDWFSLVLVDELFSGK